MQLSSEGQGGIETGQPVNSNNNYVVGMFPHYNFAECCSYPELGDSAPAKRKL